ncbi:glycosyltransferase [Buttiauxella warmboldiae]|uniref:Glycosyltransferase n=2 Tax=Buttiauxella warmboldiae TaxID=82993 RepID=A0A3N5EE95_9ENTR|nr:glycosyltransferase [Buttiauxella warmboldiae]
MNINKIIIIGYELSGLGGMETVCQKLVNLLRTQKSNIDISFVFIKEGNNPVNDDWLKNDRRQRIISSVKNTKIRRLCFANSLRKIIRKERPDLILALDTLSCFISNVARKCTSHKPVIYSWLHFSTHNLYKAKYVLYADYHLSISTEISQQLNKMGVRNDRIATIFNPVSRVAGVIPRPQTGCSFLYVGRVIADGQKNMRGLFEALAQVQGEWQLEIVGSGQDNSQLQELALRLGIANNIHWHGWQTQPWQFIREHFRSVTCLVMTSHFEGFGMVLAEASANGVYAVSSDCKTGPADIIKKGINGNLYPLDKPEQLVSLLQDIVDGKSLPPGEEIQHAIEDFYEDNYILQVISALLFAENQIRH